MRDKTYDDVGVRTINLRIGSAFNLARNPPMTDDLRAQLAEQIHRVDWKSLAPHAKRGGLVMVDAQLDLLDVAVAIGRDDGAQVQQWMAAQQLRRPTPTEVEAWSEETGDGFTVVIVQPYVLVHRDALRSAKVE